MITAHLKQLSVEEVANTLTHGAGLLLSIVGFLVLATLAIIYGDGWHIASSAIYGSSLVILYAASTFYHSAVTPHRKSLLQLVDHCCIYLLIAGSYTPFLLMVMRDSFGIGLLALVWAIAAFGIAMKIIFRGRFNAVGIAMYLIMGWLGVVAVQPLYFALGLMPLILVVAGGVSYTLGMIFFGWKSLKHHHAIFHIFVLAGSIIHFIAIAGYVLN
ncbi:MAG: hemolysin III family protein [Pyrinomonadaceae bacterium]